MNTIDQIVKKYDPDNTGKFSRESYKQLLIDILGSPKLGTQSGTL